VSTRITEKHLQLLVEQINKLTGSPTAPWTSRGEGKGCKANIGNYHISHQYGGVCLHRMMNEGGGVATPLCYGHVTKRELYNQLRAFIAGLEVRS
jgi:hypothetical protein